MSRKKVRLNYCKPIAYEGCQSCTVEFAETPGGNFTAWRIKTPEGHVRTGLCVEGEYVGVYYKHPLYGDFDLKSADLKDYDAVHATWPTWDAMWEHNPELDECNREVAEMHGWLKSIRNDKSEPESDS